MVRFAVTALLAVVLSGCGFALRQPLDLPPELGRLSIEAADPNTELVRDLRAALSRSGAELVEAGVAESGILRVVSESLAQRALSVSANGEVQEFALVFRVEAELIDTKGVVRMPRQSIELERVFSFDSAQALGTPGEEDVLRDELAREMATAVMRRVEAALRL